MPGKRQPKKQLLTVHMLAFQAGRDLGHLEMAAQSLEGSVPRERQLIQRLHKLQANLIEAAFCPASEALYKFAMLLCEIKDLGSEIHAYSYEGEPSQSVVQELERQIRELLPDVQF